MRAPWKGDPVERARNRARQRVLQEQQDAEQARNRERQEREQAEREARQRRRQSRLGDDG
ncbi:hypothetical protein QWJ26_38485 [Streptomyces sp. CSDS2]|uniref:hypothetical protein n=1 Tax=Streptomyces sp. CSDS2 TaxID=3055051 RepID=UPI0025B14AE7|nr:hypothetical protein [Streptomyces sp. CSDS2]MDN3265595.1 hypothetical protein [Streptomyces sp. CSDS2]